ncbi:MAG: hypothetical protein LCH91_05290 [Bacteroidetes bacterium]|nr:hypothetical protein [Bacteroidota bacterium]
MDNITIKLYPIEYSYLFGALERNKKNVDLLGLNSHVGSLCLEALYVRKQNNLRRNALSRSKLPRQLTLKPIEARALYDALRISDSPFAKTIFGHLDRALINAGFNNLSC